MLCVGLLLIGAVSLAASDVSGTPTQEQEIDSLLRKVEQQVSAGHAMSPPGENAMETWKQVLRLEKNFLGSPRFRTAIEGFAARMRLHAAEQKTEGKLVIASDLTVFADQANRLLEQSGFAPASTPDQARAPVPMTEEKPPAEAATPPPPATTSLEASSIPVAPAPVRIPLPAASASVPLTPSVVPVPPPALTTPAPIPGPVASAPVPSAVVVTSVPIPYPATSVPVPFPAGPASRDMAVEVPTRPPPGPRTARSTIPVPDVKPTPTEHPAEALVVADSLSPPPSDPTLKQSPLTAEFYAGRGDEMLAANDIAAARKFYGYAAIAGSARAAVALAKTYGADFTTRPVAAGPRADLVVATTRAEPPVESREADVKPKPRAAPGSQNAARRHRLRVWSRQARAPVPWYSQIFNRLRTLTR